MSPNGLLPDVLVQIIRWLVCQVPLYLVWLAAIVIALSRWRRHPRVSMLVAGASALELVASVLHAAISVVIPRMFAASSGAPDRIMAIYTLIQVVFCGVYAVAWGMVLVAAFGWRAPEHPPEAPWR